MDCARTLTIGVELTPDSKPITGTVSAGAGKTTFTGWIELVASMQEEIQRELSRSGGDANDEI